MRTLDVGLGVTLKQILKLLERKNKCVFSVKAVAVGYNDSDKSWVLLLVIAFHTIDNIVSVQSSRAFHRDGTTW